MVEALEDGCPHADDRGACDRCNLPLCRQCMPEWIFRCRACRETLCLGCTARCAHLGPVDAMRRAMQAPAVCARCAETGCRGPWGPDHCFDCQQFTCQGCKRTVQSVRTLFKVETHEYCWLCLRRRLLSATEQCVRGTIVHKHDVRLLEQFSLNVVEMRHDDATLQSEV